jgi:hypothetical protein
MIGIPSRIKWLPTIPEIKEACDAVNHRISWRREFDERTEEQLAERARMARLPRPRQTYKEFLAEMAARGMPIHPERQCQEDAEMFKAKHQLTDEQWDAIPDLPPAHSDYWAGVRWKEIK